MTYLLAPAGWAVVYSTTLFTLVLKSETGDQASP